MNGIRFILIMLATLAVALVPFTARAAPGTGIGGTAHDFANISTPATGACTFCHTPHKAQSTALLWNHKLSTNNFSWDETATTAGTTYPTFAGDTYNGPTAKCLSCHDGSVAIGDIGWWNGGAPGAPLLNSTLGAGDPHNIGLGGDMSGNHPVAMPIPFGNAVSTYNAVSTGAGIVLAEWVADPQTTGIRLFNDNGGSISAGAVAGSTGIECSSCHDPHNGANVQDTFFLLGKLGGTVDYICTKCHTK